MVGRIAIGLGLLLLGGPQFIIRVDPPIVTVLTPTTGAVASTVVMTGQHFGPAQENTTLTLNGVAVTVTSWSDSSITFTVPSTTTGLVLLTRGGVASNALPFTVTAALCAPSGSGIVRTVGPGKTFTTPALCAATATAGDVCEIYTGTYAGWTQTRNGSAGAPISFCPATGQAVTISSTVTISSRSFITFHGLSTRPTASGQPGAITFAPSAGSTAIQAVSATHVTVTGNYFSNVGFAICIPDTSGNACGAGAGSDVVFTFNTIVGDGTVAGVYLYADRVLFSDNDISHTEDFADIGGINFVARNNTSHDVDAAGQGLDPNNHHIDGFQVIGGGTTPTLSFSLIENNVEKNCTNDLGNCHFLIIRTGSGPVADTVIVRLNYVYRLDGSGISLGGIGDSVPHAKVYQNTIATEAQSSTNGDGVSYQNATNGTALNNIFYNTTGAGVSPTVYSTSAGSTGNGNLGFTTGFASGWNAPYSAEATYAALHNLNPLFANYPTDATLQAGSPAKAAGVALTTVAGSDTGSGTSLVLTDAAFFQPGWSGAQGDWIRIGASTTTQITGMNYTTNTATIAPAVTRSVGNPVYLYKNSSGTIVLTGALPNIGSSQ